MELILSLETHLCLCSATSQIKTLCLLAVPVRIIFLNNAVPQHHWCFPFAVDGNPEPNITWLYNGKKLNETRYIYTQPIVDSGDGSEKHGCLFLDKPTHVNNGNYTLIVENKLGRDEATALGFFMHNPFDNFEGVIPCEFLFCYSKLLTDY